MMAATPRSASSPHAAATAPKSRHRPPARRPQGQGPVHQRRPRVHRWPRAELPGPKHVEKIVAAYHDYADAPASPASSTWPNWRRTTSTSTSAATSTTPRRPNPRTSVPACTVASRRRRPAPMRVRSPRTASRWTRSFLPPNGPVATAISRRMAGRVWWTRSLVLPRIRGAAIRRVGRLVGPSRQAHRGASDYGPGPGNGHPPRAARLLRRCAGAAGRAGPVPAGRRDRVMVGRRPVRHQDAGIPQLQRCGAGLADHNRGAVRDRSRGNVRDKQHLDAEKRRAREHGAVPLLIPDYLNALEKAEARRADLDAQYKAATAKPAADEEDADDDVSAETRARRPCPKREYRPSRNVKTSRWS